MKKQFLAIAIAAGLTATPLLAQAEATVYGNVHISIDSYDDDIAATNEELNMNSNTSAIGVKGKEDLGGGVSALFKLEWQLDPTERQNGAAQASLIDRDQWVGLKKAGMGTVKFGTMSSNYKQMGGKVDPLYRTQLEGRGFMGMQSGLHGGAGQDGGRMTNTLQYTSPDFSGVSVVFNTTLSNSAEETMGFGVRYKAKGILAFFDYIDSAAFQETAMKFGGKYTMGNMSVALQHELIEDLAIAGSGQAGPDQTFLAFTYGLNDNDTVILTAGDNDIGGGLAVAFDHKLSKSTNTYVGYGSSDAGNGVQTESDLTFGLRHKF
ncbi:MAG: porin [Gammaproteobacteria bacterium]|nr:porin [Gammaproteobacteria bacterium]